jgi:hypothetical protein
MPRRRVRSFVRDTDHTEVCRLRLLAKRVPKARQGKRLGEPKNKLKDNRGAGVSGERVLSRVVLIQPKRVKV